MKFPKSEYWVNTIFLKLQILKNFIDRHFNIFFVIEKLDAPVLQRTNKCPCATYIYVR